MKFPESAPEGAKIARTVNPLSPAGQQGDGGSGAGVDGTCKRKSHGLRLPMAYILLVKLALPSLLLTLLTYLPLNSYGIEPSSCSSYASCNKLGTAALNNGRVDEAIAYFEQQAALAERADIDRQTKSRETLPRSPYKLALPAYNNLALAHFKKGDYFRARAWAHVALGWDKNNRAAQFNLRKIEQALGPWQCPQTPAGEYVRYAGRGTWESIVVKPASAGNIEFCFSGLWWGFGERAVRARGSSGHHSDS
jgi:tetratricopeptide repeat protein